MSNDFAIDPEILRLALRHWVTGVTVVTSALDGINSGMTVNSFNSISLDPPIVSVCLARETRTYQMIEKSGILGITILGSEQDDISNRFAGRYPEVVDRFEGVETFTMITGALFISGGDAFLDCQVVHRYEAGVNILLAAQVVGASVSGSDSPLVYYRRGYWNLTATDQHRPG